MAYKVENGTLVFVPDVPGINEDPKGTIKTPEQMQQEMNATGDAMNVVATKPVTPPTTPQQEAAEQAAARVAPMPDYAQVHTDVTAPTAPKTPDQRIQAVAGANTLEEALAAARDNADRETWVKKRLANKTFLDSLASTLGALGKFAVVGAAPDGRDVTTGDAATGSRAAYDEAAKRRDLEVAKLEALQKEGRAYNQTLGQLAEKMRIQREQQAEKDKMQEYLVRLRAQLEADNIDKRTKSGIEKQDNQAGHREDEIRLRGEQQRANTRIGTESREEIARQNREQAERLAEENNKLKLKIAELQAQAKNNNGGGTSRGGVRVNDGGSTTRTFHDKEESNDEEMDL